MTRSINEGLASAPLFTPHRVDVVAVDAPGPGVKASLDLSGETVNCDTVIEAAVQGAAGNAITIEFVDGGSGAGVLDESDFPAILFTFANGVTTVANFEAAIAASTHLAVKTAGTPAGVLASTDDEFGPTALEDGETAPAFAHGLDSRGWDTVAADVKLVGTNVTVEVLLWSDLNGHFAKQSPAVTFVLTAAALIRFNTGGQRFFLHCTGTFTTVNIGVAGAAPAPEQ